MIATLEQACDPELLTLEELFRAADELEDLVSENPSVFFNANPAQARVIAAIEEVVNKAGPEGLLRTLSILWLGGNGNGKTRLLSEIAVNLMVGVQSPWFDFAYVRNLPRPTHGRMTSTLKALQEGLIRELRVALRPHLAPGYPMKGGHPYESIWKTTNGSTLELLTWDMGVTTHAGAHKDWILKDEPGPQDVSDEDDARLRRGGLALHFATPVDETGYSRNVGWLFDRISASEEGTFPGLTVVYSDGEDNCAEHGRSIVTIGGRELEARGVVPHATIEDNYNRWKAISPATLQARFFGRHVRELGRVLTHWDEKRHVVPDRYLAPAPHWTRLFSLDTHPSKPEIGIYAYLTPFGQLVVKREMICDGLIKDAAVEIKELYATWGAPDLQLIDPLAATPNPVTGRSVLQEYQAHKLNFATAGQEKADKHLAIDKLNEMLKGVADGVDKEGQPTYKPMVLVSDACTLTIAQAKRWMRKPDGSPGKEHDDTWECIYRLALQAPRPGHGVTKRQLAARQRPSSSLVIPRRR